MTGKHDHSSMFVDYIGKKCCALIKNQGFIKAKVIYLL